MYIDPQMTLLKDIDYEVMPFFEMTPDLVCIADKAGYFKKINPAVREKLEYTDEELFRYPISHFIHPEDKQLTAAERAKLINGKPLVNFQNRYVSKTGKVIWLHWTSIYFAEREVVFAIAKDVTEKKLIEKEIEENYNRFRNMAANFKTVIEKDRKYLAIELHEQLAQLVSVIKIDVDWLMNDVAGLSEDHQKRVQHASEITDMLINTIRRISFSISPNMLEDIGLNAALQWLCREFTVLNKIHCSFTNTSSADNLSLEIQLDVFRICQEALNNVFYHSGATSVAVALEESHDHMLLTISDNGKGFNLQKESVHGGLTHMRERASSINGQLIVRSEVGKGTTIRFLIVR